MYLKQHSSMRPLELLLKKYERDQFVCHFKSFATEPRAGCLAATATRHKGSRAILPQIAKETGLCATGDGHRHIKELRSGKETSDAECRTSTAQGVK